MLIVFNYTAIHCISKGRVVSVIHRRLFEKLFRVEQSRPPTRFMANGDLDLLMALVLAFAPRRMAEFGVGTGEVAKCILDECCFIEGYLGVDVPPGTVPHLAYQREEVPTDAGLKARSDPRFHLLLRPRGTLDLRACEVGPQDFVFIDGDHSREAVDHDTRLARAVGAHIVVWHDYNNGAAIGPGLVIDELNQREGDHIVQIEGSSICFEILVPPAPRDIYNSH